MADSQSHAPSTAAASAEPAHGHGHGNYLHHVRPYLLVGAWFMHLKSEKGNIWRPLIFTFIFVTGLFLLFLLAYIDPIHSTSFTEH